MNDLRRGLLLVRACAEHQSGYFVWATDYPCCEACLRLLEKEATKCEHNRVALAAIGRQIEEDVKRRLVAVGPAKSDFSDTPK